MDSKQDVEQRYEVLTNATDKIIAYFQNGRFEECREELDQVMNSIEEMVEIYPEYKDAYAAALDLFGRLRPVMAVMTERVGNVRGLLPLKMCNRMLLLTTGFLGKNCGDVRCANMLSALVNQACIATLDFYRDNYEKCQNDDFTTYYIYLKCAVKSCADNLRKVDPDSPFVTQMQPLIDEHDEGAFELRDIPPVDMAQVFNELQPYFDGFTK